MAKTQWQKKIEKEIDEIKKVLKAANIMSLDA
jgi:hypothetical protein